MVRSTASVVVVIVGLAAIAVGARADEAWTPTLKDIRELEAKVHMPPGAASLETFTREYAGRVSDGHRLILGVYHDSSGEIVIVKSESSLYAAFDGGCGVIEVKYDAESHQVLEAFCHGVA